MENFEFEPMEKLQSKLSVGVYGPSGSGKTVGALKIAKGIQEQLYPNESLKDIGLFIDTERKSSTKTVGRSIGGEVLEPMEMYCFEPPFDVFKLASLIDYAITVKHKKIIIVDSYSAFWSGLEGILDRVSELEVSLATKKLYGAWSEKEIVKKKNILKNLTSNMNAHLIFCLRAKTEYVIETNAKGRQTPKEIGVKEDMQGDVRYEFDSVISIDKNTHEATVEKDRIGYLEIRETSENPSSPLKIEDGKILAKLVSEGFSLEEVLERKRNTYIKFILNEKEHHSSKLTLFEKSKNFICNEENLSKLKYEVLTKIVKYLQN